jgi:protocatechuate 3,4-dioxygenase beta subunit
MKNRDQRPADLNRREAMLMLGAAMLAGPVGAQSALSTTPPSGKRPSCVFTPEQTEGPYFSDLRLNRSDIRSDPTDGSVRPGVPLALMLRVHAVDGARCTPVSGATVDIWHCDATGIYSDSADAGFDTRGKKFLRGYQVTDTNGAVRFITIYPGWYPGRTVHIHFKVRATTGSGRKVELTSQLYFPNSTNERIHANSPYAAHGRPPHGNEADGLFRRGGRELMLAPVDTGQGYAASFDIGIAMT